MTARIFLIYGRCETEKYSFRSAFQIHDKLYLFSPEGSLRGLCAFARLLAARGKFLAKAQRRKGAKFARILLESQPGSSNHDTSATNEHDSSGMSVSPFIRLFD